MIVDPAAVLVVWSIWWPGISYSRVGPPVRPSAVACSVKQERV